MNFDALDRRMRIYETAHDHCVMPDIQIVVRLDGRTFTRLTKEIQNFEAPFDVRFRDLMVDTVDHLMNCGFNVVYGYTQSDEISLLLHPREGAFGRKERKLNSILAGEASAYFSLKLGMVAVFDSRVCQLPTEELVVDYFRWRQEDAHRNALNGHCYWALRREGKRIDEATNLLVRLSVADKNELLFRRGINFNDLPNWQKRGIGLYWEDYAKPALNPKTGEKVQSIRRRIRRDFDLPIREGYAAHIQRVISHATNDVGAST
jgi:tRNA(His) guanylyltransferase